MSEMTVTVFVHLMKGDKLALLTDHRVPAAAVRLTETLLFTCELIPCLCPAPDRTDASAINMSEAFTHTQLSNTLIISENNSSVLITH